MNLNNDDGQGPVPTVVPTISASVSAIPRSNAATETSNTPMEIVQQKFKDGESVLALFEAYQIIGIEHSNRLLALVVSTAKATYALFSFNVARLPPRSVADLTIDKIFPLSETFQFRTDNKTTMSHLQFDLRNAGEQPVKFYFYPITSDTSVNDFETFQAQVKSVVGVGAGVALNSSTMDMSYSWVNDYRQIGEAKVELKRREREYIVYKNYRIYCATWNVNNQTYRDNPLHLWLSACDEPPDIYAVALQELDTSPKAFVISRPDPVWRNKMMESIHKGAEYEELTSVRLVGMMLTIIVQKKLRPSIRYRVKTVARGFLGQMGNKGAVAVSMQLNEANICFVNSHLAAHLTFVEERNQDYAGIVRGCVFDDNRTINDHDHIFWIGDLNYRIEEPPGLQLPRQLPGTSEIVVGGVAGGSSSAGSSSYSQDAMFEMLLKFDQLRMEMRKENCFNGYNEGEITFRPSYKYDVGTDNYDSQKQRAPAWCDRVLWKGQRIQQTAYNSIMDIRMSDHKPVYAIFTTGIKTKDEERLKRVLQEVLKLVDKRENENQPQITVEKTVIEFGLVQFNEMAICDFTVANNCHLPVEFSFKKKDPPVDDICEKWLQVEPRSESLMIDTSKSIRIKLLADSRSIRGLLKKIQSMDRFDFDILILHVNNGPDIFITVTGEYKPSCFGLSMETLCRTDRPMSDYTQAQLKDLLRHNSDDFRVTMPREFFLLIDYLHKQGDKVEGAFAPDERFSRNVQINEIRDWLDTWSDSEFPGTPHIATEALVMLLDLPEKPLLDPYVEELLKTNTLEEAMELISLLSSPKRNVFVHLCMFLREGIEKKYYNLNHVAILFGRVLLRGDNSDDNYRDTRCRAFVHRFVSSDLGTFSQPVGGGGGGGGGGAVATAVVAGEGAVTPTAAIK